MRSRVVYGLLMALVIGAGLGVRRFWVALPAFVAAYAPDTLWATFVFLLIGFLFPRLPTLKVGGALPYSLS